MLVDINELKTGSTLFILINSCLYLSFVRSINTTLNTIKVEIPELKSKIIEYLYEPNNFCRPNERIMIVLERWQKSPCFRIERDLYGNNKVFPKNLPLGLYFVEEKGYGRLDDIM
jgi:hypothetical protein